VLRFAGTNPELRELPRFGNICRSSLLLSHNWFSNARNGFFIPKMLLHAGNETTLRGALRGVHLGYTSIYSWIKRNNHTDLDYDAIFSILQSVSISNYEWLEYLDYRAADGCVNANILRCLATEVLDHPCNKRGNIIESLYVNFISKYCPACRQTKKKERLRHRCDRCDKESSSAWAPWPGHPGMKQCLHVGRKRISGHVKTVVRLKFSIRTSR
jgi:hypothetical protein